LQILKIHTAYMNIDENVNLEDIAMRSEGASGAELRSICTEAGMFAIRNGRDKATMTDFEQALQKVLGNADATMMGTGLMFA